MRLVRRGCQKSRTFRWQERSCKTDLKALLLHGVPVLYYCGFAAQKQCRTLNFESEINSFSDRTICELKTALRSYRGLAAD